MMASLSSLVYLTCQFFRSWCSFCFFFFLNFWNGFFPPSNLLPLLCFLIVGSGHIESSVSYRWQGEAGALISRGNPVFAFSVTVHYLNRLLFIIIFFLLSLIRIWIYLCPGVHISCVFFICSVPSSCKKWSCFPLCPTLFFW